MSGVDVTEIVLLVILTVTSTVLLGTLSATIVKAFRVRPVRPMRFVARRGARNLGGLLAPERPERWLAVRSSTMVNVQQALGLANPVPCSWSEGLARLSQRGLFISPAVGEWIIVAGPGLPDPADDIDALYRFLIKLAEDFGSVQFFAANPALNHHAWVRIENGRVYRAYAWAGSTLWNEGDLTAAERELEVKLYDYFEQPLPFPFSARDSHHANADKVGQIAARWSVDPLAATPVNPRAGLGIVGHLTHLRFG